MITDYYPFGMTMPGRNEAGNYRYAYNGMETDPELKGNGNSYTTEYRQYDPRLGRWLSLDPLKADLPSMSPYCAFDNNPVLLIDPSGLKSQDWVGKKGEDGKINWVHKKEFKVGVTTPEELKAAGYDYMQVEVYSENATYTVNGEKKEYRGGIHAKSGGTVEPVMREATVIHDNGKPKSDPNQESIMESFFGDGPSLGSEGEGVYYTDKSNPNYDEWMKTRAKWDCFDKGFAIYSLSSLAAPFVIGGAVVTAPLWSPYIVKSTKWIGRKLFAEEAYKRIGHEYIVQTGQTGSFNPNDHNLFEYATAAAFNPRSIGGEMIIGGAGGMLQITPNASRKVTGIWNRNGAISALDVTNGASVPVWKLTGNTSGIIIGTSQNIFVGRAINYLEPAADTIFKTLK